MAIFPDSQIPDATDYADAYFVQLAAGAASIDRAAVREAAALITKTIQASGRIYSCGNGGSAAIANHLVCDCLKGIRTNTTIKPQVYSLSTTVETITAIGNDIGYEQIFRFQLESLAHECDLLIAISSSGGSPNIIEALEFAKDAGMKTIAMTGFSGGEAAKLADISLHVAIENYGVVEDLHQSLMHLLSQYVRQQHLTDPSIIGKVKF